VYEDESFWASSTLAGSYLWAKYQPDKRLTVENVPASAFNFEGRHTSLAVRTSRGIESYDNRSVIVSNYQHFNETKRPFNYKTTTFFVIEA
jgi:hypothetical protein